MRTCAKPTCVSQAGATMALRYEVRQVLVLDLLEEPDRNLVDLCDRHVERLKPPLGWDVVDQRSAMGSVLEGTSQ